MQDEGGFVRRHAEHLGVCWHLRRTIGRRLRRSCSRSTLAMRSDHPGPLWGPVTNKPRPERSRGFPSCLGRGRSAVVVGEARAAESDCEPVALDRYDAGRCTWITNGTRADIPNVHQVAGEAPTLCSRGRMRPNTVKGGSATLRLCSGALLQRWSR